MSHVDPNTELGWLFERFDFQRWSIACREMQVRLCHREIERAHQVLDAFARFTGYTQATMTSAVAAVLPVRLATSLEEAGYFNLQAIDGATDAEILAATNNLGPVYMAEIRRTIDCVKRGEVLEQYEEDDELLDEACFIRRLESECHCNRPQNETTMPEGLDLSKPHALSRNTTSNADQVLAALELLASSPDTAVEVLDARIAELEAEVKRIRKMRKLLGAKATPKKANATRQTIEEDVYQYVLKNGPTKPGEIAEALGLTAIAVGQAVAQSTRMSKSGYKVIIE